jgi:hypothetical protein
MEADVTFILKRQERFESERTIWEAHWQEIVDYIMPGRTQFVGQTPKGSKKMKDIFDSTAMRANRILAAGMHGQMTSPSMPWFTLGTEDPDLMKRESVKLWLLAVEKALYAAFNGSNFNSSIHEDYLDLGAFCTSCLYEEEDAQNMVRFDCRPISEAYIAEGVNGRVDTVHRKFTYTARQAYQKWGEKAGEVAVRFFKEAAKIDEEIEFIHAVYPRADYDPKSLASKDKPYASHYIELSKKEQVGEDGGYDEMPYFVSRWLKSSGEVYGRGPGMEALPDAKMVNAMAKTILRAAQKMVDPPLITPNKGFILPTNVGPASLIYKTAVNPNDKLESLETKGNIPIGLEMKNERRQFIKEAFFVDLFLMLAEKPKMTATEVMERVEEKMVVLGPTLGRSMIEKLDPIIKRTFNLLNKQGKIPPKPADLGTQMPKIEYISPLARAQKMWQVNAVNKWISLLAPIAQAKPEILDWVKDDGAATYLADSLGISPEVRNTEDDVKKIRAARAEAQEKQGVMNELMSLAEMMKKSGMKLTDLMPGAGGQGGQARR